MTAKPKPTPGGGDLVENIPDPPDGWSHSPFSDLAGAWCRGLAELKHDGADDSGPRKTLAVLRPLAWQERLIGGSPRSWRQQLEQAKHHRAQIVGRIGGQEGHGMDASPARRELEKMDLEIARLTELVNAASSWPGPDNVALRQRRDAAVASHDDLAARMEPYSRARLPFPPEWELELHEAERASQTANTAWNEGRARLDKLAELASKATTQAYAALAGALANVEDRLGLEAARIVNENEPAFLSSFPNRAPDELVALYHRAERVSGLMNELGAEHDRGIARFWRACGEPGAGIVVGRIQLGRAIVSERGPSLPSNNIMAQNY